MDIGSKIKEYRTIKKLTQVQLAADANISRSYLADVEKNRYNASVETLNKIAAALGVPLSELLTLDDKLNYAVDSIKDIQKIAKEGLENNPYMINEESLTYNTSHKRLFEPFKDIQFTGIEEKEITDYIKYILSKRK